MNMKNTNFQQFCAKLGMPALVPAIMLAQGCVSQGSSPADKSDFGMPQPGKAKVIFICPVSGGGLEVGVHDGEQLVAKLPYKTYGVYECNPGPHLFSGSFGNVAILNANLLPDRIYYVVADFQARTFGVAWVKLVPLYPGGSEIKWQKLPEVLARMRKGVAVTPEIAERDRAGIGGYMERLNTYRDKPAAGLHTILPEYGQTTPIFPR
jgi:hypothetical protein